MTDNPTPNDIALLREALSKAHLFAVLTMAFLGRDRGTGRQEKMLDDLQREAASVEDALRSALAPTQHDDATAEGEACDCARQYDPEQFDHQASCVSQPAPSEQARAEGERITKLIDQIEAGDFDELDAAADKWAAAASVQRMANAMASVFERYASQDIMDRFREKLGALMHLAFVEGAAQGVLQLRATFTSSNDAEGRV